MNMLPETNEGLFINAVASNVNQDVALKRSKVRFNNTLLVRTIENIKDMSEDEIFNRWYQKHEYLLMRESSSRLVRQFSADSNCDSCCARGLEFRTARGKEIRKKHRLDTLIAVLHEQERQMMERITDPEALARASTTATKMAVIEAHQRGQSDALEVVSVSKEHGLLKNESYVCINDPEFHTLKARSSTLIEAAGAIFSRENQDIKDFVLVIL